MRHSQVLFLFKTSSQVSFVHIHHDLSCFQYLLYVWKLKHVIYDCNRHLPSLHVPSSVLSIGVLELHPSV